MRGHRHGGTDCALPMLWATEQGIEVDVFAVYTDNETWAGRIHPIQALQRYRERTGIPAKLAVIGMQADEFTIADPNDGGMMDFVGLDPATPAVLQHFVSGPKS
jgi:60 kDa SS-A/Ro ribonucleoprotein